MSSNNAPTHASTMCSRQLANRVQRYHTWPTIRPQSTGEHACRVLKIYVELFGLPRAEVLYYCAIHDDGELAAGDVPHYAKRAVPELASASDLAERQGLLSLCQTPPTLTEEEHRRVKLADYLECYEYSAVERLMGNQYAEVVQKNLRSAISSLMAQGGTRDAIAVGRWMEDAQ